jgi:hypothetical protein
MDAMLFPAVLLALIWGVAWAVVLWLTTWGRFLRLRRTWLTVVAGVGVDLMIMGLVLDLRAWLMVWGIVAASAVGIVGFCLADEYREHREEMASFGSAQDERRGE